MCEPDAPHFTVEQEPHDLPVHEAHFAQVEHDVARQFRLNGSAQVRQLLGLRRT
jgi:hypothetical protein